MKRLLVCLISFLVGFIVSWLFLDFILPEPTPPTEPEQPKYTVSEMMIADLERFSLYRDTPTVLHVPTPTEPDVTDTNVGRIDPVELELLACAIYQEAGGDACCDDCRFRVGDVILNRVADERFPNTMEEVLTQENQYGKYCKTGVIWPERAANPGEAHAVARAYKTAQALLEGQHSELYDEGYIWQARFPQGNDYFECCGTYFGR